ncbi:dihydrolipoyl dehydrogenase [Irregularibacter muris]|uniref:Dihydrolipoyl dehydrogenase n=1 Tax=Irregularibacter muris TaxID=1796619 RepID=A0AAE3HDI1_9FIRM|nr:dihydrolipoyl dehydrogenase [Irregularibacter muris]MCR1898570.1 dihydrolipoyl dehydrogenase [Irregularibacter muris]
MEYKIDMPQISAKIKEGTVRKLYKKKGDTLNLGDEIVDITAGKLNHTIISEYQGKVIDVLVEEGQKLPIGQVIILVEGEKIQEEVTTSNKEEKLGHAKDSSKIKRENLETDIAILGGGPGGYVAAIMASQRGAKVVLVEKEKLGGTCLNQGCIPTKALVRASEVYKTVKNAKEFGINVGSTSLNYKKVKERKDQVVKQLVSGIEHLMEHNKITVVKAEGKFKDKHTVEYKGSHAEGMIKADHIIIATGSKPGLIPIPGADSKNVMNSNDFLNMESLPSSMTIIGGGVIGMEVAFILNNMGVKVNVVEMMDRILPMCDGDISQELQSIAKAEGIHLYTSSKVTKILELDNGDSVVVLEQEGKEKAIYSHKVFISIGRSLNVDNIGLEEVGIEYSPKGIAVNEHLQTNIPNIYAIGDVNGKILLAHVASHQGIVAVENILGREVSTEDIIPAGIFTDPEIAYVGLTEEEVKAKNIKYKVSKFPFGANGKALSYGATEGFVKLMCEEKTQKLLGAHIIGVHATDLIPQLTLAIRKGLTAEDIAQTVHAHPTTAETIMEAAHDLMGLPLHHMG